jgi:hypothetical protein
MENLDYDHFVRIDGAEKVLIDEEGPGVITRIWITMRGAATGFFDPDANPRLHLYVDGAEIDFGTGARGALLQALASGDLPAFPRPWVLGPDDASGGSILYVPIHFARSVKVTIETLPEEGTYYQIDWRRLPPGTVVRSFDGTLTPEERADLDAASALWVDRTERGTAIMGEPTAPGVLSAASGPGVLRRILVMHAGAPDTLRASLVIDGETIVDAPAARWMFAGRPAGEYGSSLSAASPVSLLFDYPAPIEERAVFSVTSEGGAPPPAAAALFVDAGADGAGLGRLRIEHGLVVHPRIGENFALLDASGRGHIAGVFLAMRASMWGWTMLEGDHEVRLDGDWRILGTGTEDYFGGAFYFIFGPFAHPTTGLAGMEPDDGTPAAAMFRHHLVDGYEFDRDGRLEMESFVENTEIEHCAVWYRDP